MFSLFRSKIIIVYHNCKIARCEFINVTHVLIYMQDSVREIKMQ